MFYSKKQAMAKFWFLLLLLIMQAPSYAAIIVTSIEARGEPGSLGTYKKDYKITWAKVPSPKDNEVIPSEFIYYGAMEEHDKVSFACNNTGSGLFPGTKGTYCLKVNPGETWNQVENRWLAMYGNTGPGVVGHVGQKDSKECVMFAAQPRYVSSIGTQVNSGPLICVGAPPVPDPLCYLSGEPTLEYSLQQGEDPNGKVAAANVQVQCDYPANIMLLSGTGNSYIDFNWGRVNLTFNKNKLPYLMNNVTNTQLKIEGTLSGTSPAAGIYENSLVIILGYQ
ncbi:hypothetical protein ABN239_02735 [Providencia vermicola]|uniref:hypothetical protein n=1 Tax=Providencia vermicola TaxID=333965 RepID=UPI0032DA6390